MKNNPLIRSAGLLISLTACTTIIVEAHSIKETITDCDCDSDCFTEEVQNLQCTPDRIKFQSHALPHHSHTLMNGITGTNQQFPTSHNLDVSIKRNPKLANKPTYTEPGAIGIAVNGVPIFDPSTQGPTQASTGKPASAHEQGELDECGGHAGRGDDYHYHIAPKCLIEDLGREAIEVKRKPIAYAFDGFPILALGWFDDANDIEERLDECRGIQDANGRYFYNAKSSDDYSLLNCFSGTPVGSSRDTWDKRLDNSGREIQGVPMKLAVSEFKTVTHGNKICYIMSGTMGATRVQLNSGNVQNVSGTTGSLFYCDQSCYGHFIEKSGLGGGRTLVFDRHTNSCPANLTAASNNAFEAYQGN